MRPRYWPASTQRIRTTHVISPPSLVFTCSNPACADCDEDFAYQLGVIVYAYSLPSTIPLPTTAHYRLYYRSRHTGAVDHSTNRYTAAQVMELVAFFNRLYPELEHWPVAAEAESESEIETAV